MDDRKPSRFHAFQAKVGFQARVGFAALICCGLLMTCVDGAQGKHSMAPLLVIIMTIISWGSLRIVMEGVEAYLMLQAIYKHQDEQKKNDNK